MLGGLGFLLYPIHISHTPPALVPHTYMINGVPFSGLPNWGCCRNRTELARDVLYTAAFPDRFPRPRVLGWMVQFLFLYMTYMASPSNTTEASSSQHVTCRKSWPPFLYHYCPPVCAYVRLRPCLPSIFSDPVANAVSPSPAVHPASASHIY